VPKPHFGPVEQHVHENLFNPEHLADKVPRMSDVLEGAAHLRDVLSEINMVGKFQRANGFTEDRSMQRIAKLDTNIVLMLDHLHEAGCTCAKPLWGADGHKSWFLYWLSNAGQAFDLRGKIVL